MSKQQKRKVNVEDNDVQKIANELKSHRNILKAYLERLMLDTKDVKFITAPFLAILIEQANANIHIFSHINSASLRVESEVE